MRGSQWVVSLLVLLASGLPAGAQETVTLNLDEFGFETAFGPVGTPLVNATAPTAAFAVNVFNDSDFSEIWPGPAPAGDEVDFTVNLAVLNVQDLGNLYGLPPGNNRGDTLFIEYDETGGGTRRLLGQNPHPGQVEKFSGDVTATVIEVVFAAHVASLAQDTCLTLGSINTMGEAFESTAIELLDTAGGTIGSHLYQGYHADSGGDPTFPPPGDGVNAYSASADVLLIADPITIDVMTDPVNPVGNMNGPRDSGTVCGDELIGGGTVIGGFRVTTYLEDVALILTKGLDYGGPTTTDTTFTSNLSSLTVTLLQQEVEADLAITSVPQVEETDVAFEVAVENLGPDDGTDVSVVSQLPECTQFVSDDCGGAASGGEWTWAIGDLAAGAATTCTLATDGTECAGEGEQTQVATVEANEPDPVPDNNTAEAVFAVAGPVPALPTFAAVALFLLLSLAAMAILRRRRV